MDLRQGSREGKVRGQLRMVRSGLSGSVQIEEGSGEEMSLFTPF